MKNKEPIYKDGEEFLPTELLAQCLKITNTTLWGLRNDPSLNFPRPWVFAQRLLVWKTSELIEWLHKQKY